VAECAREDGRESAPQKQYTPQKITCNTRARGKLATAAKRDRSSFVRRWAAASELHDDVAEVCSRDVSHRHCKMRTRAVHSGATWPMGEATEVGELTERVAPTFAALGSPVTAERRERDREREESCVLSQ
jgi:hypothetical protein